jgi:hypothetical protein
MAAEDSVSDDLRALLPQHKRDVEKARATVARGYPAVAPVLPELLVWLQDGNWPVAHVVAPFLATIGAPLAPEIRRVLQSHDDIWKYWALSNVVAESPYLAHALRGDLARLAFEPTSNEAAEEVDRVAREILRGLAVDDAPVSAAGP